MKEVTGDIMMYMESRAETVAKLMNITVNGQKAQQMEFKKFINPENGETYNFIAIVYRPNRMNYRGTAREWIEYRYEVTKEEGNRIYLEAKKNKSIEF